MFLIPLVPRAHEVVDATVPDAAVAHAVAQQASGILAAEIALDVPGLVGGLRGQLQTRAAGILHRVLVQFIGRQTGLAAHDLVGVLDVDGADPPGQVVVQHVEVVHACGHRQLHRHVICEREHFLLANALVSPKVGVAAKRSSVDERI